MAQAKRNKPVKSLFESARELRAEYEARPLIAERWYVIEVSPSYETGGYYSERVPEKRRIVSPYYDSEEEAQEFIDNHIPDRKTGWFELKHEFLRERVVREWCPY